MVSVKAKIVLNVLLFSLFYSGGFAWALELDVLVLYNKNFKDRNNESLVVNSYINTANSTYKNSGMFTRLRLAHHRHLDIRYSDKVGDGLIKELGMDRSVWEIEDTYRPDITVYISDVNPGYGEHGLCGKGRFPARLSPRLPGSIENSSTRFRSRAIVGWNGGCGKQTFIHEVGHVLGAGHGDVYQRWEILDGLINGTDKFHPGYPLEESVGHGVYNVFRTIMTYSDVYGSAPRKFLISNPSIRYEGLRTGTSNKNAAGGMDLVARELVRYNSACYPAGRTKDRYGRVVGRSCSYWLHCTEWQTVRSGRIAREECVAYSPD